MAIAVRPAAEIQTVPGIELAQWSWVLRRLVQEPELELELELESELELEPELDRESEPLHMRSSIKPLSNQEILLTYSLM